MLTTLTSALFGMILAGQAAAQAPVVEPARLTTATGVINGTLVVPHAAGKIPVVLIIAGSGPTDRDGNSPLLLPGRNDSYKMLAEALAADGIASLRYDKRGIAASQAAMSREADLRFDMYVDDAVAWMAQLRADARFSQLVVAGHSEGSLIGILAAAKGHADGFASIAGVAHRASAVLKDQLRPQIGQMPALWEGSETILAMLDSGMLITPLPLAIQSVPGLASLYRPSVQPYMISWFKYVPSTQLAALTMPVVLIQGSTDVQVSVDEARALKAAKPDAELVLVEGMNHVMKLAPADRAQNIAAYSNPNLPIAPEVPKSIAALVRRVSRP